ncbi:hypothetical protein CRM22_010026 [Opisthorchis felineus]|uniref:Uncharacterized protein n=1 Tax=Opisthorchis felineus TaxID=147828 RepID=A0A4S2L399_OPIFE|nr:hypothetical protein CRM22_010026 [Opisthorchis felineus]
MRCASNISLPSHYKYAIEQARPSNRVKTLFVDWTRPVDKYERPYVQSVPFEALHLDRSEKNRPLQRNDQTGVVVRHVVVVSCSTEYLVELPWRQLAHSGNRQHCRMSKILPQDSLFLLAGSKRCAEIKLEVHRAGERRIWNPEVSVETLNTLHDM